MRKGKHVTRTRAPQATCFLRTPKRVGAQHLTPSFFYRSRGPFPFFPGIFLENLRNPRENGWLLKRTMLEKNGESAPRKDPAAVAFRKFLQLSRRRGTRTAMQGRTPGSSAAVPLVFLQMAVVVKTVLGSHFGVGEFTTHFRTYFSGDWDVHWGKRGF